MSLALGVDILDAGLWRRQSVDCAQGLQFRPFRKPLQAYVQFHVADSRTLTAGGARAVAGRNVTQPATLEARLWPHEEVRMVDLFGPNNGSILWWQECVRAFVVLIYGLIIVRLAGRRVFGKWSAPDIIVSIMVGSNLSRALTGGAPITGTIAATTLLMALHWLLSHAAAYSKLASKVLEGEPQVLARDGQLDHRRRLRGAISQNDMDEALRGSQLEQLSETRLVMVEPSGKITVLKAESSPKR